MMAAILAGLARDGDGAGAPAFLVGVVERMIEAWALGDPPAIADHADDDATPVPAAPESLWGNKHDPASNFPKHVLTRCLGHDYNTRELGAIAEQADLDKIATRCPNSFKPFLDRAREIALECAARRAQEANR
jgi:hypothetical protein